MRQKIHICAEIVGLRFAQHQPTHLISYYFIVAILAVTGQYCRGAEQSQCAQSIIDNIKLEIDVNNKDQILATSCKKLPNTDKLIVAAAYEPDDYHSGVGRDPLRLLVAVTDAHAERIFSRYSDEIDMAGVRNFRRSALVIDTARYLVANNIRAFGIRINARPESDTYCGHEGGINDILTLFIIDKKKLRPILKSLPMDQWFYEEGPTCMAKTDRATHANLTISIAPTSSFGFADLQITAKKENKKFSHVLKYDGVQYPLHPGSEWDKKWEAWFYR